MALIITLHRAGECQYHSLHWRDNCIIVDINLYTYRRAGGGKYIWNQEFKTYESSVFGHPGKPRHPENISVLGKWDYVDFGVNFENDGLRVKGTLKSVKMNLPNPQK